jgi:hypothetical protein
MRNRRMRRGGGRRVPLHDGPREKPPLNE